MNVSSALLAFTLAAGALTITPGLDTALVLRTAAVEGSRKAALAGMGIALGCGVWGLAASVGLGAVLAASALAYNTLRLAGAAYLIFVGAQMLWGAFRSRHASAPQPSGEEGSRRGRSWFVRGLFTNLLNPKVGVFYVTFLPLFVPSGVNVTLFSMLLTLIHMSEGLLWFALLILATRPLSRWLQRAAVKRALDGFAGLVLVGFGGALLIGRGR
ncbi:MAG: LysE family translocator [Proteobacteria bacterium]|nr:LysE family translocator [Pseudomonadota bacterium]